MEKNLIYNKNYFFFKISKSFFFLFNWLFDLNLSPNLKKNNKNGRILVPNTPTFQNLMKFYKESFSCFDYRKFYLKRKKKQRQRKLPIIFMVISKLFKNGTRNMITFIKKIYNGRNSFSFFFLKLSRQRIMECGGSENLKSNKLSCVTLILFANIFCRLDVIKLKK